MASCFELLNEVDSLNDSQLVKKLAEYGHIVKDEFKIKEKDKIVKRKLLKHFVAKEFQNKKLNLTLAKRNVSKINLNFTFSPSVAKKVDEDKGHIEGRPSPLKMFEKRNERRKSVLEAEVEPVEKKRRGRSNVVATPSSMPNVEQEAQSRRHYPSTKEQLKPPEQATKRGTRAGRVGKGETGREVLEKPKTPLRKENEELKEVVVPSKKLAKRKNEEVADAIVSAFVEPVVTEKKSTSKSRAPQTLPAKKKARTETTSKTRSRRAGGGVETLDVLHLDVVPSGKNEEEDGGAGDDIDEVERCSLATQVSMTSPEKEMERWVGLRVECVDMCSGEPIRGLDVVVNKTDKADQWKRVASGKTGWDGTWQGCEGVKGSFKVSLDTNKCFLNKNCSQPLVEVYVNKKEATVGYVVRLLVAPCYHSVMLSQM